MEKSSTWKVQGKKRGYSFYIYYFREKKCGQKINTSDKLRLECWWLRVFPVSIPSLLFHIEQSIHSHIVEYMHAYFCSIPLFRLPSYSSSPSLCYFYKTHFVKFRSSFYGWNLRERNCCINSLLLLQVVRVVQNKLKSCKKFHDSIHNVIYQAM